MRGDITKAIKKIYAMTDPLVCDNNYLASPQELEKIIWSYCIANKTYPGKIEYKVIDGVLFMNGESMDRIAPLLPKVEYSEKASYYEGRCLKDFD